MNKLKKLQKQSKQGAKTGGTNDGLKQSKLTFKKVKEKEENKSEKDDKSESNNEDKEPLIESANSKKGSKKQNSNITSKQPKRKRGRPKSVDASKKSKSKSSSKSKSKSKSKTKTKKKSQKTKIKKGVDYLKGKYNIRVEEIDEDPNLEGKQNTVDNTCCTVCSNRNCIRAAETQNYTLMKNCVNDRDHISTLINPYSIAIGNAIDIAIKNKDKKMIEIKWEMMLSLETMWKLMNIL